MLYISKHKLEIMKSLVFSAKSGSRVNVLHAFSMTNMRIILLILVLSIGSAGISYAQTDSYINGNNNGMPNRISMNVTVPRQTQGATFGEKVNAGLHAAGGALAQGAALLGGALPGGAVISASISKSEDGPVIWEAKEPGNGFFLPENLTPGVYVLRVVMKKDTSTYEVIYTIYFDGAEYYKISNVLKTKHDTVKNSVGNIR